jgi:hypothetical protein
MKGQVVAGKYRIVDEIARGATGTVYRAETEGSGEPVAIKVLVAGAKSEVERRFEREAAAASQASHPNCVEVRDFGALEDGRPYLVMGLLVGRRLDQLLKATTALPLERALHILEHVLRGLGHAHAAGVVHRDLKPADIMLVDRDGDPDTAVILDFGTAAVSGSEPLTRAGAALGTPSYMAPERLGAGPVDGRADLYSASCILFEMLTGAPPYVGDPQTILKFHLSGPIPGLPADLAAIPGLEALLLRGLGKQPGERFATADEYLKAVGELRAGTLDAESLRRSAEPGGLAAPDANKATTVFHGAPQAIQEAARHIASAPAPSLPAPNKAAPPRPPGIIEQREPVAEPVAAAEPAVRSGRDRKNLYAAAGGAALLLVIVLFASRGCGDDKAGNDKAGPAPDSLADLEEAWKGAGLSPGGFAPIDGQGLGNGTCKAGAVNGLDVTLCTYPAPEAAEKARAAGLGAVGDATGAAVLSGNRMLVVADRKKADPSGRSINKIIKVFQGKPIDRPAPPEGKTK